jgi:hypothetical protein
MKWAGHVALEEDGEYRVLVKRPDGKRQLGRLKRRRGLYMTYTIAECTVKNS